MQAKMRAAVLLEPGKIVMEERPVPVPKDNEILVKIKHVGICGSDLHYYETGRISDFVVEKPIILGHESAGEVVETGSDVRGIRKGALVALEPGYTCGRCEYCMTGRYNLCPDVVFMATPPYDGAFCEYVAYPAHMAFVLPEGMSTLEGALIEPLAVGFHAVRQSKASIGQTAVILGAGCIGLSTMMALKAIGINEIFVVDLIEKRLEKALELGASKVIDAGSEDVVKSILESTEQRGVDLVFETAGSSVTTGMTVDLAARGGMITLVGLAPGGNVMFNFGKLIDLEISISTVFRYRNLYPTAIKSVAAGLVPLKELATDVFDFEDTAYAMEYCLRNKKDVVKGIIQF